MGSNMLTREEWDKLYGIMLGGLGRGGRLCSVGMGCKELGLRTKDYRALLSRSEEDILGDEDWVHEVKDQVKELVDIRGGELEDEAYRRAMEGYDEVEYDGEGNKKGVKVKQDNRLLERMLSTYNPLFRDRKELGVDQRVTLSYEGDDLRMKLLAMRGMKESGIRHDEAIEGEIIERKVIEKLEDEKF